MNETTNDAAAIFAPLWKRKWLILGVALLVALGTYEYYKHKPAVYSASTQLFLGGAAEQQGAGGSQVKTLSGRALADQVGLINSGVIGGPVREKLRSEHDIAAARGKATATASGSSDFITIVTEAKGPRPAKNLANGYAQAYIKRQRSDYLRNVRAQIANTRAQLRRIEAPAPVKVKGGKAPLVSNSTTLQAANLASKISQLESTLSTFAGVQQVSPAKASPLPLSPTPKKNAIFGFVLGLILASVAAYALSRLDRRVRSLADIESIFHTQILSALPSARAPVKRPDGSRAPAKSLVEPLRRLHTTLQVGDLVDLGRDRAPRVILFLSPDAGDGRSTLIANLARVQAESGERVAVIEADFRRPSQARLFDLNGPHGLADVLSGSIATSQAMQRVETTPPGESAAESSLDGDGGGGVSTVVEVSETGSLAVLVGGGAVANPPALLAAQGMSDLLRSVAGEYDWVLIDAPPPLEVSDAMALLQLVDGIVIVARIGHTRDVSAQRLAQLLQSTASAPLLGAVANCVPRKDIERYGFSWSSPGAGPPPADQPMSVLNARLSSPIGGMHPAVLNRRLHDGAMNLASVLVPLVVALAVSVAVARPSVPLLLGAFVGLVGVAALVSSPRYEVTVAVVVIYLGLLDGPIKLGLGGHEAASAVRDVLIFAVSLGALLRLLVKRQRIELPPLSGWVLAFVALVLVEALNPKTHGLLKALGGFRQQLEWVPFFFFSYALLRSKQRIRKLFLIVGVIALANGAVSTYQSRIGPPQLASWGPGYRELVFGTQATGKVGGLAARTYGSEGSARVRPPGLGSDAGAGGGVGVVALPGLLALLATGRLRRRWPVLILCLGAMVAVATGLGRLQVVGAVIAVLSFAGLSLSAGRKFTKPLGALLAIGALAIPLGVLFVSYEGSGTFSRYASIAPESVTSSKDTKTSSLTHIPALLEAAPLGVGLATTGAASGFGGKENNALAGHAVSAETEYNFVSDELGLPGLLLWVGFSVRVLVLALRRLRGVVDVELRLYLAAVYATLIAFTIMGFSGPTMASAAFGPFFWGAAGMAAYWFAGPGRAGAPDRQVSAQ